MKMKVGAKGAGVAIVVAMLSFFGFGWDSINNGEGEYADGNTGIVVENQQEETVTLYIYEGRIYVDENFESEVSLDDVDALLSTYQGEEVILYDAGAIKQTYEYVEKIIDSYSGRQGYVKIKSEINP